MIVDSHCHLDQLDLSQFDGSLDKALDQARENGVEHFLCVCIDMHNFPAVLDIANRYDDISASVGNHPNEQNAPDPSIEQLIEHASNPKVVAIGETGLDYYRCEGDLTWQHERFRRHIRAAKEVNKPLIIHSRKTGNDSLDILREEDASSVGGVFHCFTDILDVAEQAIDMGFYISLSGIVTFKNAKELQQVATQLPLERLLIETDSPYLAPVPYRGKPNLPGYVLHVAEYLAQLLEIPYEQLAKQTTENFYRLFKDVQRSNC